MFTDDLEWDADLGYKLAVYEYRAGRYRKAIALCETTLDRPIPWTGETRVARTNGPHRTRGQAPNGPPVALVGFGSGSTWGVAIID